MTKPKTITWRMAEALFLLALILGWVCRGAQQLSVSGKGSFSGAMLLFQSATCSVGLGLTGNCSSATPVAVDTTVVPTFLIGTATLTFNSGSTMASGTCNEQTVAVSGAVIGDGVSLGPPATIFGSGFSWSGGISSAGTATVALCKITTGSATPPVAVWTAQITKHF